MIQLTGQIQIQQLLELTFTTIAHSRKLFHASSFKIASPKDKSCIKLIKSKSTLMFINWLEQSVRDAIENRYLKKLVLAIYLDPSKPTKVIEAYNFDINYNEDYEENNLEELNRMLNGLPELPEQKYVTLKMYFTDETPKGYQPSGFRAADGHQFVFECDPLKQTPNLPVEIYSSRAIPENKGKEVNCTEKESSETNKENKNHSGVDTVAEGCSKANVNDMVKTVETKRTEHKANSNKPNGTKTCEQRITSLKINKHKNNMGMYKPATNKLDDVNTTKMPESSCKTGKEQAPNSDAMANLDLRCTKRVDYFTQPSEYFNMIGITNTADEQQLLKGPIEQKKASTDLNWIENNDKLCSSTPMNKLCNTSLEQACKGITTSSNVKQINRKIVKKQPASNLCHDFMQHKIPRKPLQRRNNDIEKPDDENLRCNEETRCICQINVVCSDMLQCGKCHKWLHTVCCGYLSNKDKRLPYDDYICLFCNNSYTQEKKLQAIKRRALSIIYNSEPLNIKQFSSIISLPRIAVGKLVEKLVEQGFVKKERNKNAVILMPIKSVDNKEKVKKLFRVYVDKCSLPIKDLNCEIS